MGIFSNLLGMSSEIDAEKLEKDFGELIIEGETVERAYKLFRDVTVFTDKRLITLNKEGLTGKKKTYVCLPYKSIEHFSIETSGRGDLDAELEIYVKGRPSPVVMEFRKDGNVYEIMRLLSRHVL